MEIKPLNIEKIINKLMSYYGLNQQEFAKKYRISPSQVTRWLNDGQIPNGELLVRLHMEYDQIKDKDPPLFEMIS